MNALSVLAFFQSPNIDTGDLLTLFKKAGISLLIGILAGLEREYTAGQHKDSVFAGVRTYPLISLLGFLAALTGVVISQWVLVAIIIGFFAFILGSYWTTSHRGSPGATTEVAALIVFLLGILIFHEQYAISIAAGVVTVLFLSLKAPLHNLVKKVEKEDLYATLKFAVITAIVLPILPDQTYGPFDVLNPRHIWYMVVLIAGLGFLGYLLVKFLGSKKGIALTGLTGGLVSSTAVTFSFSEKSKQTPKLGKIMAAAIILACTIMYPRILIEVAVVNSALLPSLWIPLGIITVSGILTSIWLGWGASRNKVREEDVTLKNPFELMSAIKFGAIFALILLASSAAKHYFGTEGIYLAASLAGLTDVDAITLSMANLAGSSITETIATNAIVIAALTNTIVKAGIVIFIGGSTLRRHAIPAFGLMAATGIGVLLWMIL